MSSEEVVLEGFRDALVCRYCSAIGITIILWENLITFDQEYRYVWKGPPSIMRLAFLLNRYITPIIFIVVVIEMCGSFNGVTFTNAGCQGFLILVQCVASVEIMVANMVALQRTLALWNGNDGMKLFLYGVYAASVCVTFSLLTLAMYKIAPSIEWNSYVSTCSIAKVPVSWAVMWGAPMFFEVTIVTCVAIHALATPRSAQVPLARALQRDGIFFFLSVALLRVANMSIAISVRVSLKLVAVFIIWALEATLFNRFVLRQRKAELEQAGSYLDIGELFGVPGSSGLEMTINRRTLVLE